MKRKGSSSSAKGGAKRAAAKARPSASSPSPLDEDTDARGRLILEDGTEVMGKSFGAARSMKGEVVFNTGMVGYPEALTDPSYRGQILVLTFPMVGNYGVPSDEEKDEYGLPSFFESSEIHIAGLIVSEYSATYSHWNAVKSLGKWLSDHNVPALQGVDTRMLAKRIRNSGVLLGAIEFDLGVPKHAIKFEDPNKRNLVAEVTCKGVTKYNEASGGPTIVAFDCGMKHNIVRSLCRRGFQLVVVPYDFDLKGAKDLHWDGIFVSNGPGDPTMAAPTIETLKWAMALEAPKPIFGICLGNQLLALATGAKTVKMKYGNRSMNQPCIDMRTTRCYITPQNHGFAVDPATLKPGWKTFFMNANDKSNEGIIHESKPFFSVQFHPEACGGPADTGFLFDMFRERVSDVAPRVHCIDCAVYNRPTCKKVLLLGSGGLSIGQAGEFDYSGSQAIKALREEGIEVVLINPNIATVQTSKGMADRVYFLPVDAKTVVEVIKKERPDGILVSMGGQTALNVGVELHESGELKKHNVQVLGTQIEAIVSTEDRDIFSKKLAEVNESCARSLSSTTMEGGIAAAQEIGYPVLVRAAFALGGLGSGFAADEAELVPLLEKAFSCSSQIIIDQDLRGWKEVEYEVVRDCNDNCITVCNMENFDPLGVHTGDSIVVAPSQTLSNSEYFKLRTCALKVVRHLGVVGECNIQYALDPHSERYCIIEVNARLSRSSALASKATGYPLAYVAAKLALGKDLVSIRNSVTKTTTACFEPALDYCVVKVPRWDLKKFHRVSTRLGSSMLSVGEVMAIGRSFEEAIQKACRMVNPSLNGLEGVGNINKEHSALDDQLAIPSDTRLFAVAQAFESGYSVDKVHDITKIDRWFLSKCHRIAQMGIAGKKMSLGELSEPVLRSMKCAGFADTQIAAMVSSSELVIRRRRISMGVTPVVKQIDTLAAEFPAQTNYLYMTYNGTEDDLDFSPGGVMVLGCGAYCIGSSVEFDWCAVSAVRTVRRQGHEAIVVNYNPETVSTDYDESDKLYFEELSFERVLDIYERELATGVIVSVGGQIPNNLSMPLHHQGVHILGTCAESIDRCEDRERFSNMLDTLGIDQPDWEEAVTIAEADAFAARVGYPVLLRPSYVLSGAAMAVAHDRKHLSEFLAKAVDVAGGNKIVVSKFIMHAKEIEFDGVAVNGTVLNYAMSEHVENAGVHSGDATLLLPAQKLYVETIRKVKKIAGSIARMLNITGPFNIQLMARENDVKVIECNLRASRTFPFISKTFDFNFIELATQAMLGVPVKAFPIALVDIDYVACKVPQFSFTRLQGADPTLGVEMSSTGEVACFGEDMYEAYLKAMMSTRFKLPDRTRCIFCSIGDVYKAEFVEPARLLQRMKFQLFGTQGTVAYYADKGVKMSVLHKPQSDKKPNVVDWIQKKKLDLVINVSDAGDDDISDGYLIRRATVDFGISMLTNIKTAALFIQALNRRTELSIISMDELHAMPKMGWTTPALFSAKVRDSGAVLRPRSPRARSMSISAPTLTLEAAPTAMSD
jgi:carbamoyl-phosphate synthase/aspartate carbamoyltransferase